MLDGDNGWLRMLCYNDWVLDDGDDGWLYMRCYNERVLDNSDDAIRSRACKQVVPADISLKTETSPKPSPKP